MPAPQLASLTVADAAAWRAWLAAHHSTSPGCWLELAKKGVVTPTSLSLEQAVEVSLSYGWINGQARKSTPGSTTHAGRFTPRGKQSVWSQKNVAIVEKLLADGRMQPAGLAAVELAKANGRWENAYAGGVSTAKMPALLQQALEEDAKAKATFDKLSKRDQYQIYFQLANLKTDKGREKRTAFFVEALGSGESPFASTAQTGKKRKAANEDNEQESSSAADTSTTNTKQPRTKRPGLRSR